MVIEGQIKGIISDLDGVVLSGKKQNFGLN